MKTKAKLTSPAAQKFLADHVDSVTGKSEPSERTLWATSKCLHAVWAHGSRPMEPPALCRTKPPIPAMAAKMTFTAAAGHACGHHFLAAEHLAAHPELAWQKPELRDMKAYPWTLIAAE
jgi:hypothetical protein